MNHKILIMGLPGSGKTTLARKLAPLLHAVHFNADDVRQNLSRDLGYSLDDRIEQARRMGWLCDQVAKVGVCAVADFVCPTPETRTAFDARGKAFIIWIDRIEKGRYEDTNRMFVPPDRFDTRVTSEGTAEYWADFIVEQLASLMVDKLRAATSREKVYSDPLLW
ncbi:MULTISPECIES: adenylyl-sulfate kinase [unclassified Beijerinckia]|uniref:adenylyl-sulfate kinase n=1 Tax=unclassified Beijerinckia TaxID=2638183 RepID=UPI00089CCC2A|nr:MULTISPECIES: adenylyl-sulfate kinase [unclassified Beijerinckia]MDH7794240.1 energy-coupling factor transporter ATP-binding protein EcfA2 [Beijerinckia sp. GAS462]SEB56588.1 adenylylsulfate kinase [Beijerinckia sp. 28-YEA-48]